MWSFCCVVFVLVFASVSRAQPAIDGCLLSELSNNEVRNLLTQREISEGGETDLTITLLERFPNCRAIGRTRVGGARYRSVTETVQYTRSTNPTATVTARVDFFCSFDNANGVFWSIPVPDFAFTIVASDAVTVTDNPNDILTDCARCTGGLDEANPGANNVTFHCERCNEECLEEEQFLCYGNSATTCCNAYIDDICVNECPENHVATAESRFECFCNFTCLNGGSANSSCNSCDCPGSQFTGPRCENPCDPNQCVNGDCIPGAVYPDFTCSCNTGFEGELCDTIIDPCKGVNCSGNGRCEVSSNNVDFMCLCDPGFTGEMCENEIDQCAMNPCLNGGTCVNGDFPNLSCRCLPNFSGDFCEICNLPNCRVCSRVDGVCMECDGGYLLDEGICAVNCSLCDQRETQCEINVCTFYCHEAHWAEVSATQGFDFPTFTEPSSDLPKLDIIRQVYTDATTAETAWVDVTVSSSDALMSLQPPNRSGVTVAEWAGATREWIENLKAWEVEFRNQFSEFPEFNFDQFLANLESNPQGSHDGIKAEWKRLLNEYASTVRV